MKGLCRTFVTTQVKRFQQQNSKIYIAYHKQSATVTQMFGKILLKNCKL